MCWSDDKSNHHETNPKNSNPILTQKKINWHLIFYPPLTTYSYKCSQFPISQTYKHQLPLMENFFFLNEYWKTQTIPYLRGSKSYWFHWWFKSMSIPPTITTNNELVPNLAHEAWITPLSKEILPLVALASNTRILQI